MNAPAHKFMSADDFLIWSLEQEGRWELVRGVPVRAMTGATKRHDIIVWTNEEIEGLDRSVRLSAISIDLPMAEIYEGLAFAEMPEALA